MIPSLWQVSHPHDTRRSFYDDCQHRFHLRQNLTDPFAGPWQYRHSKNIGRDILSSFKTLVGGEIVDYTNMMNEARAIATQRMVEEAEQLGADAIINVRYASSAIMAGAAEIIAYGTAVKFDEE